MKLLSLAGLNKGSVCSVALLWYFLAMKLAILNLMFLFGCMTSLISISSCQPPSPVQGVEESALIQLYRRLESDLPNPRVRPLLNSTQDLMVNLSASLFQLVDVVSCSACSVTPRSKRLLGNTFLDLYTHFKAFNV